jgi:hypothetical protein
MNIPHNQRDEWYCVSCVCTRTSPHTPSVRQRTWGEACSRMHTHMTWHDIFTYLQKVLRQGVAPLRVNWGHFSANVGIFF